MTIRFVQDGVVFNDETVASINDYLKADSSIHSSTINIEVNDCPDCMDDGLFDTERTAPKLTVTASEDADIKELRLKNVASAFVIINYGTVHLQDVGVAGSITLTNCDTLTMKGCRIQNLVLDIQFHDLMGLYLNCKGQILGKVSMPHTIRDPKLSAAVDLFNKADGLFRYKLALMGIEKEWGKLRDR